MQRAQPEPALEYAVPPRKWAPHSYQRAAMRFLLRHAAGGLFADPGLGKSSVTLGAIKVLKKSGMLSKVLVIAPLRVCYSVWPAEIAKWTDFHGLTHVILHGPHKDKLLQKDVDIYIINPDGLKWLLGRTAAQWRALGFDTLVVDELTKFKHHGTARFKMLKGLLSTFQRRWGLTGSPAANGLMDLFGQCYIMDCGRSLGTYITHYRMKYFVPGYDGYTWNLREGADQEIYERLAPLVLRISAADHLDLPQLVENDIWVDLPPVARDVYDALEEELIASINGQVVTASTAAVASMKCRQVANGGVYVDADITKLLKRAKTDREWVDLHTAKVDALSDLVDELQGAPLLAAYDFSHDLARLRTRFGKDVPYIGGGVTAGRATELERLWNAGKLPLLLVHPMSVAHGLNLQECGQHVAWHSLTWNYEHYDQLIRRVLRQGNPHSRVVVHRIMARDTVDEAVLESITGKCTGQNRLFEALKKLAGRRIRRS